MVITSSIIEASEIEEEGYMFNFCLFVFVVYAAGGSAWFILFGHRKLRLALRLPRRHSRAERCAKKRRVAA